MRVKYLFSSRRTGHIENMRKQREKYPELAKKIVNDSDIILEVLDSRFISDTRNLDLEKDILNRNKKIIFVLNKSDMIEKSKINEEYLRELSPHVLVSCVLGRGVKKLKDMIKILSKKIKNPVDKSFDKITVGVIGYPNTGKSSLINMLSGKKSTRISSEAGFTKKIQKIKLTSGIVLLDSPGVIPDKEYSNVKREAIAKHTKVGARSYSQIKEPGIVVSNLMKEFPNVFEKFYNINAEGDAEVLIEELGRQRGFLWKGGIIDENRTAKLILKDWQEGRIRV